MLCVGISNVISLLSGIALFLFGMALMGGRVLLREQYAARQVL